MTSRSLSIRLFAESTPWPWPLPAAVVFITAGVWLGRWSQPLYDTVENLVEKSVSSGDSGRLIWAAVIFVFLRSVTMLPFYWGALLAGVGLPLRKPLVQEILMPAAVTAGAFLLAFGPQASDYLAPLFILVVALILLPDLLRHSTLLPTLVLLQLFFAFLWLDQAPAMARFGFGRGDLPAAIRLAAWFLRDNQVLDLVSFSLFLAFFISAISVAWLTALGINRQEVIRDNQRRQLEMERLSAAAAQARVEKEMIALVHDLKTPLMTIGGLNSLAALQTGDETIRAYTRRIAGSVDRLSEMISEILHENVRKTVSVEELFDYVRAHVPVGDAAVSFIVEPGLPALHVNFIRLVRALINLIDNALGAFADCPPGEITVRAANDAHGRVVLQVSDNGRGIAAGDLVRIWDYGYTTRDGSSGLGLSFVRQVVTANGGTVGVESRPDCGTTVTVTLPGCPHPAPDHTKGENA